MTSNALLSHPGVSITLRFYLFFALPSRSEHKYGRSHRKVGPLFSNLISKWNTETFDVDCGSSLSILTDEAKVWTTNN